MLSSIEIGGFRAFPSLKMDDLGQVNLVVGTNDSGKTSVLDAVELLILGGVPQRIVLGPLRRDESFGLKDQAGFAQGFEVSHLFHGHVVAPGSHFGLKGTAQDGAMSLDCRVDATTPGKAAGTSLFDGGKLQVQPVLSVFGTHVSRRRTVQWETPLSHDGVVSTEYLGRQQSEIQPEAATFHYVTSASLMSSMMADLWSEVALTTDEEEIIQTLQIIDPDIERIVFLPSGVAGQSSMSRIVLKHKRFTKRVPLASMGDGIRRLLALSLSAIRSAGGYLLIDEIDTGLHYSVMSRMWEMLIETAARIDAQIFATTHSLDCIRSLAWLYEEKPGLCDGVRLHRIEKERDATVVYSPDEFPVIERDRIEVR